MEIKVTDPEPILAPNERRCKKCGLVQNRYLDFYYSAAYCKSCMKAYQLARYHANKGKHKNRREELKTKFAAHALEEQERRLQNDTAVFVRRFTPTEVTAARETKEIDELIAGLPETPEVDA